VVEIGKKAAKLRRLPQRRREQLPPKSNADTAWRELCGRDSVGRSGTKAHEDVTDHAAKRWDDDWRESYEQLSADASKMDMETIRCELIDRDASQHLSSAPAHCLEPLVKARTSKPKNSFKPSVKARAGKLKKMMINRQKQLRRRLKRRQARDVKYEKKKDKCCLIDAFRALGFRVPYVQGGPFLVLKDGSDMLRLFGYSINPEARLCAAGPGRWLICRDGHCVALLRKGEGNTRIIDGTNRKRIADRDLDMFVKGAGIYRVPAVDVAYCLEFVIPIVVCVCEVCSL